MVIFGGLDGSHGYLGDVWALSFAGAPSWSQLAPAGTAPVARYLEAAIYDPVRDRMLIFGGVDAAIQYLNDTWALSFSGGLSWNQLAPSGLLPIGRTSAPAIYDPIRDRMVIFGGNDGSYPYHNDSWSLALAGEPAWSELAPSGDLPPARYGATGVYDAARDQLVIFAGAESAYLFNDTWTLEWTSPTSGVDPIPSPGAEGTAPTGSRSGFALQDNVPNPFRSETSLHFVLPGSGARVALRVFDVGGRVVKNLVEDQLGPGEHTAVWDGRDAHGHQAVSGVYYARLEVNGFSQTRKMVLSR